ncbi:MAG: DUF4783 domain-containing protein [Saprospiraceae bacterium]
MRILNLLFVVVVNIPMSGQGIRPFLDAVIKMDNSQLEKYLASDATITVENQVATGEKNVVSKLSSFVTESGVKTLKIVHEGVAKGKDSIMGIGSLISDKGKFRVYLTFKNIDGLSIIQEIRIERDTF